MNSLPDAIYEVIDHAPTGISTEEICNELRLYPQEMGDAIEYLKSCDAIYGFAGMWLSPPHYEALLEHLSVEMAEVHEKTPLVEGHDAVKILRQAGVDWPDKPLVRLAEALIKIDFWRGEVTSVRSRHFELELSPRQRELIERVMPHFPDDALTTPSVGDLIDLIPAPVQAVEEIMRLGVISGHLRAVAPGVWYTPVQLEAIYERLCNWASDGYGFTIAEFRAATGISRKYADALLFFYREKGALVQDGHCLVLP